MTIEEALKRAREYDVLEEVQHLIDVGVSPEDALNEFRLDFDRNVELDWDSYWMEEIRMDIQDYDATCRFY